jgi:hypothetical protein
MASAVVFSTAGTANTASTDVSPGDVGLPLTRLAAVR